MRQFSNGYINEMDLGDKKQYWFENAMISACEPLFDDCDSNYDVELKLRKAGVIHPKNQTDSESCALVVNFSSKKSGEKFIERLNRYLEEKERRLREATNF